MQNPPRPARSDSENGDTARAEQGATRVSTVLIANRGEIAVRAARAARESGLGSVAVFPVEDRHALHRLAADRAVQIGEEGAPLKAYLSIDELVGAATSSGADALYPGYGFLSENPELATACVAAGITFVGPPAEVLELTGNKSRSVAAARAAGIPVLQSTAPSTDASRLVEDAAEIPFPVFVKAIAGGGGRGMRRVDTPDDLPAAIESASREAAAAFGDGTVFIEQAVVDPRHIEVQILADTHGDVIHLFERDCSLQRRHQKVVEIAPAPNLDPELRERICADAVRFARSVGYSCAGTVEFLLDDSGRHVFIEMNPRIQVEHTVTEEVTGVDLVSAQLRIAGGASLADLGLDQGSVSLRGTAIQCRVTTEDPAANFRPDTGRISVYSPPGGVGVRLDGNASVGTEVTAFFDSLLVKLTCSGPDFARAVRRARRALDEFVINGVSTNIDFLRTVLAHPDFLAGRVRTTFIDAHPELTTVSGGPGSTTRVLDYLADITVNRPWGDRPTTARPRAKLPDIDTSLAPPRGSRDALIELGPAGFATALRQQSALGVTDTTFRDAHQSLLATRVRTSGLTAAAGHVARLTPELWSVECWGGATYDVALRFLSEDPWERLDALRAAMPNVCLQMLLRGRNTVGYTPYPESVTRAFVDEAARSGIDVFRIFDALNDVGSMRPAIDAVLETGTTVAEVAMSFTGDLSDPNESIYTLDYWLRLAESIVDAGAHVLAIKDMAGLLRPPAARMLVTALRREFDLPIHLHTHDTAGGQLATYLAAVEAGADAVDGASAPMSGTTSQPSLSAIAAMVAHTDRDTGLDLDAVMSLEPYWEAVRAVYRPFESVPPGPTGRVYHHEIPGGQLSNLRAQAGALGLADRFEAIEEAYAGADRALGRIIKVTPSSKVVGDLALHLVGAGVTAAEFAANPEKYDVPDSVVRFFQGELGRPVGGWPEPLRSRVLAARGLPNELAPPEDAAVSGRERAELDSPGETRRARLNELLFPDATAVLRDQRTRFGNLSSLSAHQFFYGLYHSEENRIPLEDEPELHVMLEAISEPDKRGERTVHLVVNGQPRIVTARDRSVVSTASESEKADQSDPGHVAAPFTGAVTVKVAVGDRISAGDTAATIEAMKMEASIGAQVSGRVSRVLVPEPQQVDGGDLLVVIDPD